METKKCRKCGNELPATTDYFYVQKCKWTVDGIEKETIILKAKCKSCDNKDAYGRHLKKRYTKLGCDEKSYKEAYAKQRILSKLKIKELYGVPHSKRTSILKKVNRGYLFTTIEQYDLDCKKCRSDAYKRNRKYDYGDAEKVTPTMLGRAKNEVLTDSILSHSMGYKIGEVPKEILELKRTNILLKRELGLTHKIRKNK